MQPIRHLHLILGIFLIFSFGCLESEANVNQSSNATGPTNNITTLPTNNLTINPDQSWEAVTGNWTLIKVPDPLYGENEPHILTSRPVPNPGESFLDSSFGTNLTRITQNKGIRHEYSRFDPYNLDQSMMVLLEPSSGNWHVYRTISAPYDSEANLVATLVLEDPRWDPNAADIIWGLEDFSILKVNVSTGMESIAKDFSDDAKIGSIIKAEPDLYRITMFNEGESSVDKRYWAFILQGSEEDYRARYIFTYDLMKDEVLGIYRLSEEQSFIDWVGMSSLGNYVLIGADPENAGNLSGLVMANRELTRFNKLDYATSHSDVGVDSEGGEVIVMQNSQTDNIDLIPLEWNTSSIDQAKGSYAGSGHTKLINLFYNSESAYSLDSGVHISCNCPGYCVVSTYMDQGLEEQNWLDRSIVLAKLNPSKPEVYYLAKVHGTTVDYWEETQASISNDCSRVAWATNWNQSVGLEEAKSVFMMELRLDQE